MMSREEGNIGSHAFRSRVTTAAISLLTTLAIGGCAHYSVDIGLKDENFKPKGTDIAVISGTKEPQNVTLARMVSDSLRKKSRYRVASEAQISRAMKPYPQTIKGPYKSAYFSIDTDWELGDRQRIAKIQRSLGVDYLYVIWAPIIITRNGSTVGSMPAVAQLFEQPNTKEVAQSSIDLFVGDEGNVFLKEGVEEIAQQLAEQTKMARIVRK